MQFQQLTVNARAAQVNLEVERIANRIVRSWDEVAERLHLGGRAAKYDDVHYEFVGGAADALRKKHYDKSLRLLWKGEAALPWSSFRDCNEHERELIDLAERNLTDEERAIRGRITSAEFKALLDREYTLEQKRAIVAILSAIGHGEAYAWLVSASLLPEVHSTGAKAALTMQILEEAKHFVVMRELMLAFGVEIPRQSVWEYLLLEGALKAKGLDKFFGMNVLVESIALSIFGVLSTLPGLDVLRLFHLDESRHTALPANYFKEFPLSKWQKRSPLGRVRRLKMALPALPLIMLLEADLAVLGIDAFDFAGSVMRKVTHLSERAGFLKPVDAAGQTRFFNQVFNAYCKATRPGHRYKDFMLSETTAGEAELAVEREAFGDVSTAA
ncbi:MAG: hypothetical protein HS104_01660 [Polyangiaceae bacterium]|nr:hypothetical protein [Polyangiaceae bacterium]MCE7889262.1 hypothetical protein [Sorangiineae bacterium PRO1]MCL4755213.1 hypothetical protein [Myxococcales bacterium]